MNRKTIKNKDLYILIIGFYVAVSMLAQSEFKEVFMCNLLVWYARIICYIFCAYIVIIYYKCNWKSLIIVPTGLIISFLVSINSGTKAILDLLIILITGRYFDSDMVIEKISKVQIITLAFIIFCSLIGVIDNELFYRSGIARQSLGFEYATYSANYYFHAVLALLAVKKEKISFKEIILYEIVNLILFYFTNTLAAFSELAIALLLCYFIQKFRKPLKEYLLIKWGCLIAFPLMASLIFYFSFNYSASDSRWFMLNNLLTGRLSLGHQALQTYPISAFGQYISWSTGISGKSLDFQYFYVDSSYIQIALMYGWVTLLIVICAFTLLMKKSLDENKTVMCIALLVIAFHSATDPQLILLKYNVLLLALTSIEYRRNIIRAKHIILERQ